MLVHLLIRQRRMQVDKNKKNRIRFLAQLIMIEEVLNVTKDFRIFFGKVI